MYTVNKSSRYLSLLAPVFALESARGLVAFAWIKCRRICDRAMLALSFAWSSWHRCRRFLLLREARNANYNKVAMELRSVIHPGQAAFGTCTFWLALTIVRSSPRANLDGSQGVATPGTLPYGRLV